MKNSVKGVIFFGLFFLVGAFILKDAIQGAVIGQASLAWPMTSGAITSSSYSSSNFRGGRSTYRANISYSFQVRQKTYSGEVSGFGGRTFSQPCDAQSFAEKFPPGKKITVYYDPGNPARSVLQPGFKAGLWGPILTGGLFALIGLGGGFAVFYKPSAAPEVTGKREISVEELLAQGYRESEEGSEKPETSTQIPGVLGSLAFFINMFLLITGKISLRIALIVFAASFLTVVVSLILAYASKPKSLHSDKRLLKYYNTNPGTTSDGREIYAEMIYVNPDVKTFFRRVIAQKKDHF